MNILQGAWNDISGFFGYDELLKILKTGSYSELLTLKGIEAAIGPILPLILVFEVIRAAFYKRFKVFDYKISFFTFVFNAFIGQVISIGAYVFCVGLFQPHAIFDTTFTWYWFIYSYVVWEFSHFIYHFLAHKVRILWCLHSTHHAPSSMNLSVSYAHFFLEGPYATVIRTSICMLLGVNPAVLAVIMFVDGTWGGFIHIGENIANDARFGFLGKIILTPSHHRVHHAKNPKYMDTNFCNLLNIWDKVFGTYQPEDRDMPIEYGITRPMKPHSFLDAYFGEIVGLAKDVAKAPGLKNKVLYIVMPPGWSHTGDHKTSAVVRKAYFEGEKKKESKSQELVKG
ncbi:sterol desaturase family protein [Mucilaginibacter sp.]|uniref:sterol desaturase family protein n=1 Tax=Mucilaginibacter sp. TaxID=1882438 RepID=UPI0026010B57|nr:sterol desaturase family protein [Mucilaginibacter sp.]